MPDNPQNLVHTAIANGATAQLRIVVRDCDDRDTARPIYAEILRLAHELARKHNFAKLETVKDKAA